MERLTRKSDTSDMVWFIDREHESGYVEREPCDMDAHHSRLAIAKLAEYEDFEEIFQLKMTAAACDLLKDKEEFSRWLDRNKWIAKKCGEYAKSEEQGKLLKLPCAVGDTIYVIPSITNYKLNIVNGYKKLNRVYEQIVNCIEISKSGYLLSTCDEMSSVIEEFYKVTWFLTKEEANTALEELARECKEMGYEID